MALVKVYYDQCGNTLTVWFGNPEDEFEVEETGDEIVLMKDQQGDVIGFEKLNFRMPQFNQLDVAFETISDITTTTDYVPHGLNSPLTEAVPLH